MKNASHNQINQVCAACLDATIDQTPFSGQQLQHLQSCASCRQAISLVEQMRQHKSAFLDETHPELRLRLARSLAPLVAARRPVAASSQPTRRFAWFWQLGLALVLLTGLTLLLAPGTSVPGPGITHTNGLAPEQFFTLSLNGGNPCQVSLDNPLALFTGDCAEVILPDQSRLQVNGPARLTLNNRGFHLLQGQARVEVVPGSDKFSTTTPHGIIDVLGTVFVCEVHTRFTTVEVISGKVRVSSDSAPEVILGPGQKSQMGQQTVSSTETETIPSLDSE